MTHPPTPDNDSPTPTTTFVDEMGDFTIPEINATVDELIQATEQGQLPADYAWRQGNAAYLAGDQREGDRWLHAHHAQRRIEGYTVPRWWAADGNDDGNDDDAA